MAVIDTENPSSGLSDWLLELLIGVTVVVLALGVWAYSHLSTNAPQDKPRPVWLGISKVITQMADGRMVSVKVNLRLTDENAVAQLEPHIPAFKALIQEAGTQASHDELQSREGMSRFGKAIVTNINDYLNEHEAATKVKSLAFDELILMP